MKRWAETRAVLEGLEQLRAAGVEAALATVVRVSGSAYRREGAKLLVGADGTVLGNVSGGCLEEDVREVAMRVLATGRAELRSYCSGAEEVEAWDLGVGCEGVVEVFVAPAPPAAIAARMRDFLAAEESFVVATLVDPGEGSSAPPEQLTLSASGEVAGEFSDPDFMAGALAEARAALGGREGALGDGATSGGPAPLAESTPRLIQVAGRLLFLDLLRPPPRLLIVGGGDDTRPLAAMAVQLGFRVAVADRRSAKLASGRFPEEVRLLHLPPEALAGGMEIDEETRIVIMTHSYAADLAALRAGLTTPAGYLGVLGPRARTERLLATLVAEHPAEAGRVHGPIGVDIGGEGAEAVALSILAEILNLPRGRGTGRSMGAAPGAPHVLAR